MITNCGMLDWVNTIHVVLHVLGGSALVVSEWLSRTKRVEANGIIDLIEQKLKESK